MCGTFFVCFVFLSHHVPLQASNFLVHTSLQYHIACANVPTFHLSYVECKRFFLPEYWY